MEKVYVYKSGDGYRVFPAVVILKGGERLRVINATDVEMTAIFPEGAVKASKAVEKKIPGKGGKADVEARSQDIITTYTYTVEPPKGAKAKGNSDPVLIIEN